MWRASPADGEISDTDKKDRVALSRNRFEATLLSRGIYEN